MDRNIEINIEELVLQGFAPEDRYKIGEEIKVELKRLVSEHGLPDVLSADIDIDRLYAGTFTINKSTKAESIGNQTAKTVYGGLKR